MCVYFSTYILAQASLIIYTLFLGDLLATNVQPSFLPSKIKHQEESFKIS